MTCIRVGGTGTVAFFGGPNNPIELFIIDMNEDPGDTGMDV